ncbi:MAG: inositol monophosphatase family protein [Bdellovibrionota bacterium]
MYLFGIDPKSLSSEPELAPSLREFKIACGATLELLRKLGITALKLRSQGLRVDYKTDGSVFTNTDEILNRVLVEMLPKIFPAPVVSEENKASLDLTAFNPKEPFWLVDPLDGSRSYAEGYNGFGINVALITNQRPILSVVGIPSSNQAYLAIRGNGAVKVKFDTEGAPSFHPLSSRTELGKNGVLTIAGFYNSGVEEYEAFETFLSKLKHVEIDFRYSSAVNKYCAVADNRADIGGGITIDLYNHDFAAPSLIISEAGGMFINPKTLKPIAFTPADLTKQPAIAISAAMAKHLGIAA